MTRRLEKASILEKASAALDAGALKQAEQLYRQLSQVDVQPERTKALYGLGQVTSRQGKFDEAKDTYRHLLQQARDHTDPEAEYRALYRLGSVERMAGNPGAALELLERGKALLTHLDRDDALAAHHLEVGLTELSRLNLPAAALHFREVLTATKVEDALELGYAYQGLGDVAAVRRDTHEAHYYFQKAQKQFEHAEAYRALAQLEARLEALESEVDELDFF